MKSLIPILIICLTSISVDARQRGFGNQRFYAASETHGVVTARPLMSGSDSSVRVLSDISSKPQNPIREKISLFPEIERLSGFETSFGPGIVWTRPLFQNQVLHLKASQVKNNLKSPHSAQSLTINKLELEWKYYLNTKLFFSSALGFRDFKANASMYNYYRNRGENLKEQDHLFGSLSVGMKIVDKMPLTKTALTARIGWHFSEEFVFPSKTPTGTKSLDFDGVRFGMGMGF